MVGFSGWVSCGLIVGEWRLDWECETGGYICGCRAGISIVGIEGR